MAIYHWWGVCLITNMVPRHLKTAGMHVFGKRFFEVFFFVKKKKIRKRERSTTRKEV